MTSPAKRHRQNVLARQSAKAAGLDVVGDAAPDMVQEGEAAAEYRNLRVSLDRDLRALRDTQSLETRAIMKIDLIKPYLPWCEGALDIEEGVSAPQDDIVVTCMIWALDIGSFHLALNLADHCITHALVLPERFNRNISCFVMEEIAAKAIKTPGSVPHEILIRARPDDGGRADMPDQARSKYHRALGESFSRLADDFNPQSANAFAGGKPALMNAALKELNRAVDLHERCGAKKMIEKLGREVNNLAQEALNKAAKAARTTAEAAKPEPKTEPKPKAKTPAKPATKKD